MEAKSDGSIAEQLKEQNTYKNLLKLVDYAQ
jgi:hypothetical protein